jgi:D-sedoheptulose 7-phosphate isomerase
MTDQEMLKSSFEESVRIKTDFYETYKDILPTIAKSMGQAFQKGNKVIAMGNGGSASDALHLAGELTGRFMKERQPLPAIVLGSGMASLTAIANDYSYETAFKREMQAFAKPGDVVFAISTSGKSKNVCHAAQWAKQNGCLTIGLIGGNGGLLAKIVTFPLIVNQAKNSARCQETHIWLIHSLIELMDEFYLESTPEEKHLSRSPHSKIHSQLASK